MPEEYTAGTVEWDPKSIEMEKLKAKLPLALAGGLTGMALRGGPRIGIALARQAATAKALRNMRAQEKIAEEIFTP